MSDLVSSVYVQIPLRATIAFLLAFGLQLPFLYVFIKVLSHIHARLGPMYPGRLHGVGWPLAEGLKWIQKEDIVPASADRRVFKLAPLVVLVPAVMVFAAVPIAPGVVAAPMDIGLFYILAISSVGAIGVVMAAYASASKFTLIGGLRAVGQIIAYELPVVLGALAVAMLAGDLSMTGIVEAQQGAWFLVWPLPFGAIAFVMFLAASLAEAMWAPFDMPVAESEIIAGPYTEYSGMRYIFFQMAEFWHVIALSAIGAVLFLGGWNAPFGLTFVPAVVWMLVKFGALVLFFIWVRFTLPRLREDQLQKFAWKVLIPIGLANVLGIALFKVLT